MKDLQLIEQQKKIISLVYVNKLEQKDQNQQTRERNSQQNEGMTRLHCALNKAH